MTGSSEFNEVFLTDVHIPDVNRVGDVGDGWRCARTTLMNERVALAGVSLDPVSFSGGIRRDAWQSYLDNIPDRKDPRVRQTLAQFYIESEVKEITAFRANSARMRGQQPGPEGAVNKVFNAEYNQRRSNFAVDANGMAGIAWASDDGRSQAAPTPSKGARRRSCATRWPNGSSDCPAMSRPTRVRPGHRSAAIDRRRGPRRCHRRRQ
jgi:alkylation response protein AidB-like acyl-CoA dehydrogenase